MIPIDLNDECDVPSFFQPLPLIQMNAMQSVSLRSLLLSNTNGNQLFYVKSIGDSMFPTLHDTDHLLISMNREAQDEDIVLLNLAKGFVLARIDSDIDTVSFVFDNSDYKPIHTNWQNVGIGKEFVIMGVVSSIIRMV